MKKCILTITGSDGTCGSGIQADVLTITSLGGRVSSVITSITAQNSLGIQEFYDLSPVVVRRQIEAIVNDQQPDVVKIGLLRSVEVVEMVVDMLKKYHPSHIVYVPTLLSARGERLIDDGTFEEIKNSLIPLCSIVIDQTHSNEVSKEHGYANKLASAAAYYLSLGMGADSAMSKANKYMKQNPSGFTDDNTRSGELYNLFINAVETYYHVYSDVAFYAEQLNVSPRYLGQVTRQIANRSPKSIIDERITAEIVKMMATTSMSLKEIANKIGFSSQAHLSRFFKKQKGCAPKVYKIMKQKGDGKN